MRREGSLGLRAKSASSGEVTEEFEDFSRFSEFLASRSKIQVSAGFKSLVLTQFGLESKNSAFSGLCGSIRVKMRFLAFARLLRASPQA